MNEKLKEFDRIVKDMRKVFVAKNHDYGDDNISVLGSKGVYVRIFDKVSRLKTLIWENKSQNVKDEKISDTLLDLSNYAIIMEILLRNKWK